MKQIVFLTSQVRWGSKPFIKKMTENTFRLFAEAGNSNNVQVAFTSPSMIEKDHVARFWFYQSGWKIKKEKRKVQVVYSYLSYNEKNKKILRSLEKNKSIKLINPFPLMALCYDKAKLSKFIDKGQHPQTFLVHSSKELIVAAKKISSAMVVIKPRFGLRGEGVELYNKKNLPKRVLRNSIVQEFIELKKIKGRSYDLRLMMINSRLDHAYYRIAPKGSFKANCSLGATKKIVDIEKIPGEAWEIAAKIDKKLEVFSPRIYSIDLIRDKLGKYYVLELESMPGFYHYTGAQSKFRKNYLNNIFKSSDI